jgi:hypothetical protein
MPFADRLTRIEYEKADAAARAADVKATAARERLAKLRVGNGKTKASGVGRVTKQSARAALQDAIAAEKRAQAAVERIRKAVDGSFTQSAAARRKLESAQAAIDKVGEADAEAAAKAVAAGRTPPASTLVKAQAKVADAESVVEQIGVGRERLEQRQREAERAHEEAKHQVQTAIDNVLRAEWPLAELLDEVARLSERRAVKLLTLREWSAFATPDERRLIDQATTTPQPGTLNEGYQFAQHPTTLAIAQTRAALAIDVAAPVGKL